MIPFQPSYHHATNCIATVGAPPYPRLFTYDHNGNLTSTGTGTGTAAYTWYAGGHMIADSQSRWHALRSREPVRCDVRRWRRCSILHNPMNGITFIRPIRAPGPRAHGGEAGDFLVE